MESDPCGRGATPNECNVRICNEGYIHRSHTIRTPNSHLLLGNLRPKAQSSGPDPLPPVEQVPQNWTCDKSTFCVDWADSGEVRMTAGTQGHAWLTPSQKVSRDPDSPFFVAHPHSSAPQMRVFFSRVSFSEVHLDPEQKIPDPRLNVSRFLFQSLDHLRGAG